jgi:hypothetical protein
MAFDKKQKTEYIGNRILVPIKASENDTFKDRCNFKDFSSLYIYRNQKK